MACLINRRIFLGKKYCIKDFLLIRHGGKPTVCITALRTWGLIAFWRTFHISFFCAVIQSVAKWAIQIKAVQKLAEHSEITHKPHNEIIQLVSSNSEQSRIMMNCAALCPGRLEREISEMYYTLDCRSTHYSAAAKESHSDKASSTNP